MIRTVGFAARPTGALPVRLSVQRESAKRLDATLVVQGLKAGKKYRLERRGLETDEPEWTREVTARTSEQGFAVRVDKKTPALFRCVPVPE